MHVEFWGAAQTVTGSMHMVRIGTRTLVLDCGLYQGQRKLAFEKNRNCPIDPKTIDAIVLSHAHIDHSGNLPSLVRNGYRGKIFATHATKDLCTHMLLDSAEIQESDVRHVNKERQRTGKRLFEPLYVRRDALQTLRQFKGVDYHKEFEPIPGVRCRFHDAGHMLGSTVVEVNLEENGESSRLVFSGDIGRKGLPILRDPETVAGANFLIMEATYGDRLHPPDNDTIDVLKSAVQRAVDHRGVLIIPAFSVGRSQQILYSLNSLWKSGELPKIPVYVDSPLAADATTVFRSHFECFDEIALQEMLNEEDRDILGFPNLHYVRSVGDSKALNFQTGAMAIISASGMCEAGRVLHHLKHHISDPSTTILFTGYQADHTLGRRILDGADLVRIFGNELPVRATVMKMEGASGHADQGELLSWADKIRVSGNLKQVALVHTEVPAATAMKELLEQNGFPKVIIPAPGDKMNLALSQP